MVKKTSGNTILCVEDEVFRLLDEEDIHLVLLDLKLFESDGWQILEKIKKNPETSAILVIVYTALIGEPQQERASRMGAADYIIKPLSANILRNAASRILPI